MNKYQYVVITLDSSISTRNKYFFDLLEDAQNFYNQCNPIYTNSPRLAKIENNNIQFISNSKIDNDLFEEVKDMIEELTIINKLKSTIF